jgi:TRAP-type mannitol/chloroaromatic compound transport system permease small subunit
MINGIDRGIGAMLAIARWLALGVALLLFAQWPLREGVQAYSREANDVGQWLFALFVAVSVTAATRSGRHIAADGIAQGYAPRLRRALAVVGILFGLLPWALFVLVSAWGPVSRSVAVLERFQDTGNGGYFIVKLALLLLLGLMILQALVDLTRPRSGAAEAPRA